MKNTQVEVVRRKKALKLLWETSQVLKSAGDDAQKAYELACAINRLHKRKRERQDASCCEK